MSSQYQQQKRYFLIEYAFSSIFGTQLYNKPFKMPKPKAPKVRLLKLGLNLTL